MFASEGVYWIRNKSLSSRLIDVSNNPYVHSSERDTMPIGLLSPGLAHTQLWLVEEVQNADGEFFVLRNYATGTALDVQDGSSTEGSAIVVQPYKSTGEEASSQHWKIDQVSDDDRASYYRITNQKTGTVLDQTRNSRNGDDYSIESRNSNDGDHQLWSFELATFPDMYWLLNIASNRCLQYKPTSTDVVTLEVKSQIPSRSQLWYLEDLPDHADYFRIRQVDHEDKVLDLSGGDNRSILAWSEHGGDNQRWKINDVDEDGAVNIVCGRNDAVLYGEADQEGGFHARGSADTKTFEDHSDWLLVPCPIPSLFWTNIESSSSANLMAQSGGSVTAGAPGEVDDTAQWRFVNQGREPHFAIIDRQTGNALRDSSGNLVMDNNISSDEYHWVFGSDGTEDGCRITNLHTSNLISYLENGNITSASVGTCSNQQWLLSGSQSFPKVAFAMARPKSLVPYNVTWSPNPRLTSPSSFIKDVFTKLIAQLDFDQFTSAKKTQLAEVHGDELNRWVTENKWSLPNAYKKTSQKEGWCRIDVQVEPSKDKQDANRANIQGQCGKDSVFHVLVELKQNFGRAVIQKTMLESLEKTETARLVSASASASTSGSKPKPKPKRL